MSDIEDDTMLNSGDAAEDHDEQEKRPSKSKRRDYDEEEEEDEDEDDGEDDEDDDDDEDEEEDEGTRRGQKRAKVCGARWTTQYVLTYYIAPSQATRSQPLPRRGG